MGVIATFPLSIVHARTDARALGQAEAWPARLDHICHRYPILPPGRCLLQALRKRPLEPFRIQVSDGSSYEVRHPELVMVGLRSAAIGVPVAGQDQPHAL